MSSVDFSRVSADAKDIYGVLENQLPDFAICQKRNFFPFSAGKGMQGNGLLGNRFREAVVTRRPNGFTYNLDGSAFTLGTNRAMVVQEANVTGATIMLEEKVSVATLSRTAATGASFKPMLSLLMQEMDTQSKHRLEVGMLYGGGSTAVSELGKTSTSVTATASTAITGSAYDGALVESGNTHYSTITLDTASWAAGIWIPAEGAGLQFYTSGGTLTGVQTFDLIAVDAANRTITVAGTNANVGTLVTAINTPTQLSIWWEGARTLEMVGLNTIAVNTGTLFNLNGAINGVYKGNSYSAGSSQMTFGKYLSAMTQLENRGLMESTVALFNPRTWANIMTDISALRRIDSSYKTAGVDIGSGSIKFHTQVGETEIVSHPCVKEGDGFIFPKSNGLKRVGSTDLTFSIPGSEYEMFYNVQTQAAIAFREMTDQNMFTGRPSHCLKITNIVNVN